MKWQEGPGEIEDVTEEPYHWRTRGGGWTLGNKTRIFVHYVTDFRMLSLDRNPSNGRELLKILCVCFLIIISQSSPSHHWFVNPCSQDESPNRLEFNFIEPFFHLPHVSQVSGLSLHRFCNSYWNLYFRFRRLYFVEPPFEAVLCLHLILASLNSSYSWTSMFSCYAYLL